MRLPDFLVIGAAKSGTTSLFNYLRYHPQIFVPTIKEPNFFGMDEHYAQGLEHYAKLFNEAKPSQLCGEASTDYSKWPKFPQTAARIAQTLPHVKLIYIMRNPIERAYSYYSHINRYQPVKETFEEYLCRTTEAIDASTYMLQIEQYLSFFPRESFLFLLTEDLTQPTHTLKQVCRFLEIDDTIDMVQEHIAENQGKQVFEDTIRGKVTAPLRSIPMLASIATALPQEYRDFAYKILKKTAYGRQVRNRYLPQPMRPETKQILLDKFQNANQDLARFLQRDLSHWTPQSSPSSASLSSTSPADLLYK